MAEIFQFPTQEPRLRLVQGGSLAYQLGNLTEAADCAGAAVSEITNAVMRIVAGAEFDDKEVVLTGETLEEVLNASLFLIKVRGSAADSELMLAIINWLEANRSGEE